jgi:8-oxo-dGTP pyrophosphatase MutT (NUDIX family)
MQLPDFKDITVRVAMPARPEGASRLVPQDASAAIITVGDGYLMQHRDDHPWIFHPGHWGLFGGAFEPGESALDAMRRELREELDLSVPPDALSEFCALSISLNGLADVQRVYFTVALTADDLLPLKLGEGQAMRVLSPTEIFERGRKVCPHDAIVLWSHIQERRE